MLRLTDADGVRVAVFLLPTRVEPLEVLAYQLRRHAVAHASDHVHEVVPAAVHVIRGVDLLHLVEGLPDLDAGVVKVDPFGKYAHDDPVLSAHADRRADDGGIRAEAAL